MKGTIGMSSGKWYWEITVGLPTSCRFDKSSVGQADSWPGQRLWFRWYYGTTGQKYTNSTGSAYGSSYTTSDVIGVAFDADAGSLYFYKNGAVQNSGTAAFTGLTSGPYYFATGTNDAGTKANAPSPTPPLAASRHFAPPTYRSQRLLTAAR
jgi:hypothetical protein